MKFKKLKLFSSQANKVRSAIWDHFAKDKLYRMKEAQSKGDFNDNKNKLLDNISDKYIRRHLLAMNRSKSMDIIGNKITPDIEKQIAKSGEQIFHYDTSPSGFYYNDKSNHVININPNTSDDSTLAHEYQHMKNYINGEHPGDKYTESNNKFRNPTKLSQSLSNSNDINDYIHDVLAEENSANRGRLINSYLHSGDKLNSSELDKIANKSKSDQETYTSLIGNPSLQNLRHNMDNDIYNNLKISRK